MCQETNRGETSAWGKCEMEEIEPHDISRVSTLHAIVLLHSSISCTLCCLQILHYIAILGAEQKTV